MPNKPLEYATDNELFEEIFERHDYAAFVGVKERSTDADGPVNVLRQWKGRPIPLLGLLSNLMAVINMMLLESEDVEEDNTRPDDEEEHD